MVQGHRTAYGMMKDAHNGLFRCSRAGDEGAHMSHRYYLNYHDDPFKQVR